MEDSEANVPLEYPIEFTANAELDLAAAFLFTVSQSDARIGKLWAESFWLAVSNLSSLPNRNPWVPARLKFRPPTPRQLVFRRTSSSPAWHVIYRVHDAGPSRGAFVEILTVRHGSRKPLSRREAQELDGAA